MGAELPSGLASCKCSCCIHAAAEQPGSFIPPEVRVGRAVGAAAVMLLLLLLLVTHFHIAAASTVAAACSLCLTRRSRQ
jgi:hypothetical protein